MFLLCIPDLPGQSKSDYWIAFRLLKYSVLLLSRYVNKKREKLPLICSIVLYNGKSKYNAPLNFWELFSDPKKAKELMAGNYKLIDLHATSDDDILKNSKMALFEYCFKHIHNRNKEELLRDILEKCREAIIIDKERGYILIVKLLRYIDTKIPEERKAKVAELVATSIKGGDEVMRSIAQSYIDEGVEKGVAKGIATNSLAIAKNLLKKGLAVDLISETTGLSKAKIRTLKVSK